MRHGSLLALLLLLACSAQAVEVGAKAPAFTLPRADGTTLALDALAGRVVVVDFWASWCAPCRRSFPALDALEKRYGAQGLSIVGVNVDTERDEADRFLKAVPVSFAIVFDADGKTPEAYGVRAMPSTYVVGRDGTLKLANLGFREKDEAALESAIRSALAEAPK